jgi:cytochrome oxidase assembly protein ShyY1
VYRFLLSPRWLRLFAGVLLVATCCVLLGFWQLDRRKQKVERNHILTTNLAADPVPAGRVLAVGRPVDSTDQWTRIRARGRYDEGHELLVRNRPLDGTVGYYVLTPLSTDDGPALIVNRGWVPAGATAATRPKVPPPPSGEVVVTGRLRVSEPPSGGAAPPPGEVTRIDVPGIASTLPYKVYGGFVELISQEPPTRVGNTGLRHIPVPVFDEGPHLAYAVQWFMFAIIALVGVVILARREAADRAAGGERARPPKAPRQPADDIRVVTMAPVRDAGSKPEH